MVAMRIVLESGKIVKVFSMVIPVAILVMHSTAWNLPLTVSDNLYIDWNFTCYSEVLANLFFPPFPWPAPRVRSSSCGLWGLFIVCSPYSFHADRYTRTHARRHAQAHTYICVCVCVNIYIYTLLVCDGSVLEEKCLIFYPLLTPGLGK